MWGCADVRICGRAGRSRKGARRVGGGVWNECGGVMLRGCRTIDLGEGGPLPWFLVAGDLGLQD